MKFISLSAPPSYCAKWNQNGDCHFLKIGGKVVLISSVAPVDFFTVIEEPRPYEEVLVYQGTDDVEAKRIASETNAGIIKTNKSLGLPDGKFCIDRSMGIPVYITGEENDANGCLVQAAVVGKYGFKAESDGEILSEHRVEVPCGTTGVWFVVMAVLLPGQSLSLQREVLRGGTSKWRYSWDGRLLTTKDVSRETPSTASAGPWGALSKL